LPTAEKYTVPLRYCDMTTEQKRKKNAGAIRRRKARYHSDPEFRSRVIRWTHETAVRRKFKLEPEEVRALLLKQEGRCAICKTFIMYCYHIDHNHTTGVVRGLLCGSCNRGIGLLHESVESLKNAVTYLEGYK
jgi:Recombination endonuclease VII